MLKCQRICPALERGACQQDPGTTIVESIDPLLSAKQLNNLAPTAPFTCRSRRQEHHRRRSMCAVTEGGGEEASGLPRATSSQRLTRTRQDRVQWGYLT